MVEREGAVLIWGKFEIRLGTGWGEVYVKIMWNLRESASGWPELELDDEEMEITWRRGGVTTTGTSRSKAVDGIEK